MKKSLIALAVAATAGTAFAQSSVTLFGVADIGYGTQTAKGPNGAQIKSSGVMDGGNAGNRVGFRGSESLGGGLSADFWVEQGLNLTNGELFSLRAAAAGHQVDGWSAGGSAAALSGTAGAYSTGTNRQSWVGLRGGFGNVRIGYQYTNQYELSTLSGYAQGSEGVQGADKAHLIRNDWFGGTRANGLTYISPSFSGLTIRVQYGAGSDSRESVSIASGVIPPLATAISESKRTSILAHYGAGPLSAMIAHTKNDVVTGATSAANATMNAFGATTAGKDAVAVNQTRTLTQLGASYDMKVTKLSVTYNNGDNGTGGSDAKGVQVSATAPFGKTVPFISWGQSSVTTTSSGAKSEDYKMLQWGVRHSLSNRTTTYLMVGETKNDASGAAYNKDSKAIVGVAHSF